MDTESVEFVYKLTQQLPCSATFSIYTYLHQDEDANTFNGS